MGILIPLVLIAFTSLCIWRACDGFELASRYLGRHFSEGVRGGTINAIGSSMPELFTTLIALFVLSDEDGLGVGLGTTVGSALFNGLLIPAFCVLTVVGSLVLGRRVTEVTLMPKVVLRDGLTLLACELLLLAFIRGGRLVWWQGALMVLAYALYLGYMLSSMPANGAAGAARPAPKATAADPPGGGARALYWLSLGPLLDLERYFVRHEHEAQMADGRWNAWPLLGAATVVIGLACWVLVHACEWLGSGANGTSYSVLGQEFRGFGMPTMFVAVIFASMATSVPDTVISIRDARGGEHDDAVANALGSNVFDICIALGLPLLLYTLIHGPLTMEPAVAEQCAELVLLLVLLSVAGGLVFYLGRRTRDAGGRVLIRMAQGQAMLLFGLYALFVAYILGRSADESWAQAISSWLRAVAARVPEIG
jgi:cation:H+ antiporter